MLDVEPVGALILKAGDLRLLFEYVDLGVLDCAVNAEPMPALECEKVLFGEILTTHAALFCVGTCLADSVHKWHLLTF